MKMKLLAMILLGSSTMFAGTNFYIGIGIGSPRGAVYSVQPPPPPPPPVRFVSRSPGRGYVWVPGYWVFAGSRYNWRDGYWAPPVRGKGKAVGQRRGYR